jgi:esterase/lipase superfamily enzyme
MQIEYHKWHSPNLGHEMELKVYGYYGKPAIIFPALGGRFYDFENFGMVAAIHDFIEKGKIKLFTVDSIDNQCWSNYGAHPYDRGMRHEAYDRYIIEEVVPFSRQHCGGSNEKLLTSGCSMGAYHAANFFFRHPDQFDAVIALSGMYHLGMFVGDYMDERVYYNSPLAYLANLDDPVYLDQYRQSKIIICTGQGAWEEAMEESTHALKDILEAKGIPAWIDFWGHDVNHDWPWWRKMLPYYLDTLNLPGYSPA